MLEYYLLLIVVTLFLLNELFNILSCVSVWAPLFALMILFNLLSSWSWDWTLPLLQLWLAYCNTCTLIFLSLKLENGMKKHVRNVFEIKYGFVKLVVIFFTFHKILLCDSFLINGKLPKVFGEILKGLLATMLTDETVLLICLPNWNGWKLLP